MELQTLYNGCLAGKDKFFQVNPAPLNTLKYFNTQDKKCRACYIIYKQN
jgi:hypothetical protein